MGRVIAYRVGFTLVELLVVIGIIALLISILLPSLNKARDAANTVACLANLRSLNQGVAVYQARNAGAYPPCATTINSTHYTSPNVWTLTKVAPGTKGAACPTVFGQFPLPDMPTVRAPGEALIGYLYSRLVGGQERGLGRFRPTPDSLGTTFTARTPRTMPNAAETAMFMESPMLVIVEVDPADGAVSDRGVINTSFSVNNPLLVAVDGNAGKSQIFDNVAPVHSIKPTSALNRFLGGVWPAKQGIMNVAYCDGSARSVRVRQGQQGLAPNVRGLLNTAGDATANGVSLPRCFASVEGTRYDPYTAP